MPDALATSYDVLIVGGGAGGLSAARAASRDGATVALVSDSPLGGDCTFTGCVPSKTLIEAAHAGLSFADAMRRVEEVVDRIAATENADVLRGEGVDVIEERGVFVGTKMLDVGGRTITGEAVVIATGAKALIPPIEGLDTVEYLTNHELFELRDKPASLGILGGGPIGCEMAQAFAQLGVAVTLFEMADRVLLSEDPMASEIVVAALRADGVTVRLGAPVTAVRRLPGGIEVTAGGGEPAAVVEQLLVAVGRTPNTQNMGLDRTGVDVDRKGFVIAGDDLETTQSGIFAVGDVNGKSPFTHAADEMGRIAVGNARGRGRSTRFKAQFIPRVTFTSPEVASVGVAEADAPRSARVVELPMHANDRALTADVHDGYIKLIVGKRRVLGGMGGGQVLGASIVGPRAGELIHEPTLAIRTRMFAGRLAQTVHAYPTWSSGIQKAAGMLFFEIEGRTWRPPIKGR